MRVELAAELPAQERNALLAGLPEDEWDPMRRDLQRVKLVEQVVLHHCNAPLEHAYFPLSGYVALLVKLSDGFRTEIGDVGNEGMIGLPLVLGQKHSNTTAVVQVSGEALRISASALTGHTARSPTLHRRLLGFVGTAAAHAAQLAACNTHHTLDVRLARCLLGLDDRTQDSTLSVTHDSLAGLLCVHRPSVSVAITRLQRLGLLRHGTRSVVIADRRGLERASCDCYPIMHGLRGWTKLQSS